MKNILVHGTIDQKKLAYLQSLNSVEVTVMEAEAEEIDWSLSADIAPHIDILLSTHPPKNLSEMTNLKLWQIGSVGYTQLVGLGLPQRNVRACNARGVFDVPIGEWNISMMINLVRDLRQMIRNQDVGVWDPGAQFQQEINGSVVGIWGYGGIGRETARLCKMFGMTVHVLSRHGVHARDNIYRVPDTGDPEGILPDKVFLPGEKTKFLAGLDFLIVAMPLTASTEGIIGREALQALPKHAYILNPARGPIIQQAALLEALDHGLIAGAALDTHYHYPMPADHVLWGYPNVIMTPHISGSSANARFTSRIWSIFVENVERFLAGKSLLNELTSQELDGES